MHGTDGYVEMLPEPGQADSYLIRLEGCSHHFGVALTAQCAEETVVHCPVHADFIWWMEHVLDLYEEESGPKHP